MKAVFFCLLLFSCIGISAQTNTDVARSMEPTNAETDAILTQLQVGIVQLQYMDCERSWQHTSYWRRWNRYSGQDPCKEATARHKNVVDAYHILLKPQKRTALEWLSEAVLNTVTLR